MIIFVQLQENRRLKYVLTFDIIGWANNDLNDVLFVQWKSVLFRSLSRMFVYYPME